MRRGSVTPEEEREQSEATQAAVKEALASVAPVVAENEEEKAEYQLEEAFAEDEEARALLQKQKARHCSRTRCFSCRARCRASQWSF